MILQGSLVQSGKLLLKVGDAYGIGTGETYALL